MATKQKVTSLAEKYPEQIGFTETKKMKEKIEQYGYAHDMTKSPTMRYIVRKFFQMIEKEEK